MKCFFGSFLVLSVAALLAGCDGAGLLVNSDRGSKPDDAPIENLIVDLRSAGADVARSGNIAQPFFSGAGHLLKVNGETVQVFAYATVEEAAAEAAGISPDGSSFHRAGSATMVTWLGPPHFFRREVLLVLYVGTKQEVLEALGEVLGPQFAGR